MLKSYIYLLLSYFLGYASIQFPNKLYYITSLVGFCVKVVKKKLIYHYLLRNGSFMDIINKRHRDMPENSFKKKVET